MYITLSGLRRSGQPPEDRRSRTPFKVSSVILTLGVVSMMTDISSESVAAVLPLYVTSALGLSMVAYGFLDGLNQGLSAVVRIGAGWAADRTDRPKPVAVLGYGLSMLARVGLLFAQGFTAVTAVVGVDRIGKGIRTAPRDALIKAVAQPEHLARSFGVHRMLDTVGATMGPVLAYVILALIPGGYRAVFIVSLAFAVVGLAVLVLLVPNLRIRSGQPPEPAAAGAVRPRPVRQTLALTVRALNTPGLRRLLLAAGLLGLLTVGDGFIYLTLFSHGHFPAEWFPLMFVGTNIVYLAAAIPLGRLADGWGRRRVFVLGHGTLVAAYLCASVPGFGPAPVFASLLFLGLFYAMTDGVLAALAGAMAPEGCAATGIAAAQTVVALARLIASTGFGVLWFVLGAAPAMLAMAAAMALAVPVGMWLMAARRDAAADA